LGGSRVCGVGGSREGGRAIGTRQPSGRQPSGRPRDWAAADWAAAECAAAEWAAAIGTRQPLGGSRLGGSRVGGRRDWDSAAFVGGRRDWDPAAVRVGQCRPSSAGSRACQYLCGSAPRPKLLFEDFSHPGPRASQSSPRGWLSAKRANVVFSSSLKVLINNPDCYLDAARFYLRGTTRATSRTARTGRPRRRGPPRW
jgi:hypothetical protein